MCIRLCFIVVIAVVVGVSGQSVKSSVEFYDTVANKKLSEIGSTGSASGSTFFIEENGTKRLVISKDTVAIDGTVKAGAFAGNGSKLTGVTIDSISWDKIKNMPAGFADGVDNSGAVSVDSVRATKIADSSKTVKDGSITREKFAPSMKISADSLGGVAASRFSQVDHIHTNYYSKTETDAMMSTVNYCYSEIRSYCVNGFSAGANVTVATITVNAPTAGKIIIIGNANVFFENVSSGSYVINGGIVSSPTSVIEPNTILIGQYGLMMSWSQTRVFSVASGEHTFYLIFENKTSAEQKIWNPMLTAIFTKD
jgi:hypothetical protein